jgi:hypothetical protein
MSDGGKGSKPRPFSVSPEKFANNFDAIFGKKKKTDAEKFDEQVIMKEEHYDELEDYKRQAQGIWNDSCTSPRKK